MGKSNQRSAPSDHSEISGGIRVRSGKNWISAQKHRSINQSRNF